MKPNHINPTTSEEGTRNLFIDLLPAWVKVSNRSATGSHQGLITVPKSQASEFDQVQINTETVRFICIDVDAPANEWKVSRTLLLPPHLVPLALVETPSGGYHIVFAVDFVNKNNERARTFLDDIRESLRVFYGGDKGYTNWSMRNPLSSRSAVTWFAGARVYTLREFKDSLRSAAAWKPKKVELFGKKSAETDFTGENHAIYDYLCEYVSRQDDPEGVEFDAVLSLGLEFNSRFESPRSEDEVYSTARSAVRGGIKRAKWRAAHTNGMAPSLGSRGGQARSSAQYEARCDALDTIQQERAERASERRTEALRLKAEGMSVAKIARALGVTRPTIYADLKAGGGTEFQAVKRNYDPSTKVTATKKAVTSPAQDVLPQAATEVTLPVPTAHNLNRSGTSEVLPFVCECFEFDGTNCYTTAVPEWTKCLDAEGEDHVCGDIFGGLGKYNLCGNFRRSSAFLRRWQEAWEHRCSVIRAAKAAGSQISHDAFSDLLPHLKNPAVDQWADAHHSRQHAKGLETKDCKTCSAQAQRREIEQVILNAGQSVQLSEDEFVAALS